MVKRNKRKKKKIPYVLGILFFILLGVASWSLYNVINTGVSDGLSLFGIENFYLQNSIIIAGVFILLLLSGYGIKKSIDKLIK